jgi:hypothetical protein
MTQATFTYTNPRRPSLPLRRVDGVELPAAGTWSVPGRHATIEFSVPRRLRRPECRSGRAREASVVISEDPDDVFVSVLFDVRGLEITGSPAGTLDPPMHIEARSVPGPHRWALAGGVLSDTGVLPLRATLGYHGIWRRGDHTYSWFELVGAIGAGRRIMRQLRFRFELLASAPEPGSRPLSAQWRARSVGPRGQTAGAA